MPLFSHPGTSPHLYTRTQSSAQFQNFTISHAQNKSTSRNQTSLRMGMEWVGVGSHAFSSKCHTLFESIGTSHAQVPAHRVPPTQTCQMDHPQGNSVTHGKRKTRKTRFTETTYRLSRRLQPQQVQGIKSCPISTTITLYWKPGQTNSKEMPAEEKCMSTCRSSCAAISRSQTFY